MRGRSLPLRKLTCQEALVPGPFHSAQPRMNLELNDFSHPS
jgi:hypothetical protein